MLVENGLFPWKSLKEIFLEEKKYAYGYYLQFSENSKDKEHDLIIKKETGYENYDVYIYTRINFDQFIDMLSSLTFLAILGNRYFSYVG